MGLDIYKKPVKFADQPTTDAGTNSREAVSPLTLKNFKGIEGYFLNATGAFGTGGGWADEGFIDNVPVVLYDKGQTERAMFMNFIDSRYVLDSVNPQVAFTVWTTGTPVADQAIRFNLTARYIAEGEQANKPADEDLFFTFTPPYLATNTYQGLLVFTLDRTKISDQDVVKLALRRIGGDIADTYPSDIGVGQSGIIIETYLNQPNP
jgi:hypothetical protein